MTTNALLLDEALSRLGQRSSTRVRADVLNEINNTINRLERGTFIPWFLESTASLSIVADDTFVALPADFILEQDETRPYYTLDGKVYYLTKRLSLAALQGESPTSLKYYALNGGNFHFRMAADQAYTVYLPYYARETGNLVDNTNTISNQWLIDAKDWVLGEALTYVAGVHLQNTEKAALQAQAAAKAKNDLYVYHESRIHQNQDYEVGGATSHES